MIRKYSIEDMHTWANNYEGQCLSSKYINANSKLKWCCNKGHIWEATPSSVRQGHWCLECSGSKKKNINDMHNLAKERGGKCLSKEYINTNSKLKWQCNEGHIWEATPHNIKNNNWCPDCGDSKKSNLTDMRKLAESRGGKCLSQAYKNAKYKLKWKCSEGHTWEALPAQMKKGGWCPECSLGLGERICRVFFQQIFNYRFSKFRPKWLINDDGNQMELDEFCKSLKLAFAKSGLFEHLIRFCPNGFYFNNLLAV